ncbi:HAAS signaling domain-containing protein [Aeromicrobium sp. CF3.5]|uniref:HAAS signaling domain-containing protein n=1 Tax=Aeromicrobium sp. CF3.5 TaxID=3373078 RepID=UPI003EE702D2
MSERSDETTLASYRQELILALRLKNVPGDRIGEIVAEVESHVADTGEHPTEAFGIPRDYAATLTTEHRTGPWWFTTLTVIWSFAAGWLVAQGLFAVLLDDLYLGRSGWLWIVLGLAIGVPGALAVRRRSTRVADPRTGEDMVTGKPWAIGILVGTPIAIVLVSVAAIHLFA